MSVLWQGVEYPCAAWGVQGFRLESPIPRLMAPGRGRVAEVALLIGPAGTRIQMQVQVRALSAEGQPALDYQFIDLTRPQAEVLHRVVDHAVNDKAMSLTRLLDETEQTRVARQQTTDRTLGTRRNLQLAVAFLAVALAVYTLWGRYTSVPARYAAVTASATAATPVNAGLVQSLGVSVGQPVEPGDVIARVQSADHERRLQALTDERQRLEAEQTELTARRAALSRIGAVADQGHDTERARLDEALRIAERRLAAARAQLAEMRSTGLPTARRQAERAAQESVVHAAERELNAVRRQADALAQNVALSDAGVLPGGGAGALGTLDALELRLTQLDERLAEIRARELLWRDGEPVVANCDCLVARIDRRIGEFVDPSRPIATLVERGDLSVHALVLSENARAIRAGDPVRIALADGQQVDGQVSRLNYAAHWPGYAGLQDNVFAADRYARLEIIPDRPIDAPVGMTASVRVSTDRIFAPLWRRLGL